MGVWQHFMEALGVSSRKVRLIDLISTLPPLPNSAPLVVTGLRPRRWSRQWRQVYNRQPAEGKVTGVKTRGQYSTQTRLEFAVSNV